MFETIIYEKVGHLAKIILHRPDVYNAVNRMLALEVQQALDHIHADKDVRAVWMTGEGKAFCAGQDLKEIQDVEDIPFETIIEEHYNPMVRKITELPIPVIAHVQGVAAGAGANLALCCDIVTAAESAGFTQAFGRIGLLPDTGGTWFLPKLVGYQRAMALMMTGEKINGIEAQQMGMIYKAFPDESATGQSLAMATMLSEMPTQAMIYTKKLVQLSYQNSLETQLEEERNYQALLGKTADFKEGIMAFLQKRKPEFKGN